MDNFKRLNSINKVDEIKVVKLKLNMSLTRKLIKSLAGEDEGKKAMAEATLDDLAKRKGELVSRIKQNKLGRMRIKSSSYRIIVNESKAFISHDVLWDRGKYLELEREDRT